MPEHFVALLVIGIWFTPEIFPRLHFGLFHRECCGFSRHGACKRVRFCFETMPYIHLLHRLFALLEWHLLHPAAGGAAAALNSCHSSSDVLFQEFLEQERHAVCKGLSYIFVCQCFPLCSVGPPIALHVRACPVGFSRLFSKRILSRRGCATLQLPKPVSFGELGK